MTGGLANWRAFRQDHPPGGLMTKNQITSTEIYQNTIDAQGAVSFLLFANKFSMGSTA